MTKGAQSITEVTEVETTSVKKLTASTPIGSQEVEEYLKVETAEVSEITIMIEKEEAEFTTAAETQKDTLRRVTFKRKEVVKVL